MEYGLVALWLVTYLALLYVGMPIARALMPRLADRGAGVALPLALAVVWLVAYYLGLTVSIRLGLFAGLAVLAVLAVGLWYRGYEIDNRAYAEAATVFTLAFLFMIVVRAFDPSAHPGGGEKFLDMGLLQSLLRSSTLPPEDAWFAGETVRYYYGGHYLSSLLVRITGTPARYGYNLALAGFFGMLVTGVYGVAGSIAASRGFSQRRAGVLAAFFVGFASNLHTAGRFLLGFLPDSVVQLVAGTLGFEAGGLTESFAAFGYWPASRVIPSTINEFPLFAWLNGDLHAHMMSTAFMVLVVGILADVYVAGTDTSRRKRFAVLFGVVPALAGLLTVTNTWSFPSVGGLVGLTLAFGPVSPAALLSPRFGAWIRDRHAAVRESARLLIAAAVAGVVLVLGALWAAPFLLWTASETSGIGFLPTRSGLGSLLVVHGAFLLVFWLFVYRHSRPLLSRPSRMIGAALLLILYSAYAGVAALGLFVPLIMLGWLLTRLTAPGDDLLGGRLSTLTDSSMASDGGGTWRGPGFETVLMVGAAGLIVLVEFVYVSDILAPQRFNTVFKVYMQVWLFAGIAAGVMLARLLGEDDPALGLSGRGWQRFRAVLAGVIVAATSLYGVLALIDHLGLGTEANVFTLVGFGPATGSWLPGALESTLHPPGWVVLPVSLFVVLVVGIAVFRLVADAPEPYSAGVVRFAVALAVVSAGAVGAITVTSHYAADDTSRIANPTLDSLAYVAEDHPTEAAAIEWLLDLEGQPNMVSNGAGSSYQWNNAEASLTGVPTLVGWGAERGYRGPEIYDQRVADVETIFTGNASEQRRLLAKYDVELVYVGPNERIQYGTITVEDLDALSVAKSWDSVTIYRVDQSAL